MPYVNNEARERLAKTGDPLTSGELNYGFTLLAIDIDSQVTLFEVIMFMARNYVRRKGLSYQAINDVMGALTGARKELYRRTGRNKSDVFDDIERAFYEEIAVPYEDQKIKENGDVYG